MAHAQQLRTPSEWHVHGAIACLFNLAMACIYLWMQRGEDNAFLDAPLVVLITLNSFVVFAFGTYLVRDLADMVRDFPGTDMAVDTPIQTRIETLLCHRYAPVFAIGYALFAGTGGYMIAPWEATSPLRSVLALFIFSGNLFIGYAVFGVMQYWGYVLRNLASIDFHVLNLSRPPLPALLRFNSRVVLITAFVASTALLGLGLSRYDAQPPIVLFSLFAFAMTAATYAVPVVPISNRLRRLKTEALDRVEAKIQAHVFSLSDPSIGTKDLPPLASLKEARDLIAKIQTLPPGGQVSVSAAALATVLPFIPSAVEYLSKLFELGA